MLPVLAAACAAQAQSNVTLYGIVDAGLRYSNGFNGLNLASSTSSTAISSGINLTSRLGFRGSEDMGGGLKGIFNLESGINVDTGSNIVPSKFFDRTAIVGLQGGFGTVTVGRQVTLLAEVVGAVDPLGTRFAALNPNIAIAALNAPRLGIEYGPSGGPPVAIPGGAPVGPPGSFRVDNSIKYAAKIGAFNVRVMHAFGEQPGNRSNRSASGIGGAYKSGNYTAALSYMDFKSPAGLRLRGYLGGVSGVFGKSKLSLTYGSNEANTSLVAKTRHNTFGVGGTFPLTPQVDLIAAYYRVNRTRTGFVADGFDRAFAFAEYKFSKRTRAYLEMDHTRWKTGYPVAGVVSNPTGVSLGLMHSF